MNDTVSLMESELTPQELDRFTRSLERCLADPSFTSHFYARFLLSSEDIARRFDGIDLKRQATVLKSSLYLVMRAAHGLEDGLDHLARIAESHSANHLGVEPHHYRLWLDALLAVMRETGRLTSPASRTCGVWCSSGSSTT
ncbi:MAG: globin [Sandaracinaceae bacterium]